jgi:hypothetical protein
MVAQPRSVGHVQRCVALRNQIRGFDISMHNANTAEEGKSIKSLPKKDNSIIGADRGVEK